MTKRDAGVNDERSLVAKTARNVDIEMKAVIKTVYTSIVEYLSCRRHLFGYRDSLETVTHVVVHTQHNDHNEHNALNGYELK